MTQSKSQPPLYYQGLCADTYLDLEEMHPDLVPAATKLQIGDSLRMRKGRLFCVKEFHETRT